MSNDSSSPHPQPSEEPTASFSTTGHPGERIGSYTVLEKLGEGGMGIVFVAEQTEPVRRRVALKVIKQGMDTKQVIARFEAERQALALMDHPAIAKIYDAGATPDGRPYFAMEYVRGVPITEHCDRQKLTNRQRLDLFLQVCEGVQHAHQKAVIHRDLKPSNVLVSIHDGHPAVKIIDFGVAKAVSQRLTERTLYTELGVLIGTPEYMSPEQAEMTGQDVDTRSDVYSLGVMLYELLVGALPFEPKELRKAGLDEIRRRIREEDPRKPSARLSTMGDRSTESARLRGIEPRALRRELLGDLDWITMRALEKDRARRYGSPGELAADLRRHVQHEPVSAGPPSVTYRASKFVRRNRLAVVAACVVTLALVIGVSGLAVGFVRVKRAQRAAKLEAETTRQVSDFLIDLLRDNDPEEARGSTMTVREVLDRGTPEIGRHLKSQPLLRARMLATIGNIYTSLGLFPQARPLLEEALALRTELLGPHDPEVAEGKDELGMLLFASGDYDRAGQMLDSALEIRRQVLGPDDLAVATSLHHVASLRRHMGDITHTIPLHEQALAIRERALGPDDPTVANSLAILSSELRLVRAYDRARSLNERAIAINEKALGEDSPELARDLDSYASLLADIGNTAEAEVNYQRALRILEKDYGEEHPIVAHTLDNLALLRANAGRYEEARALYRRAVSIQEKTLGPRHRSTGWSYFGLGLLEQQAGALALARTYHQRALEIRTESLGADHSEVGQSLECLSQVLEAQGDATGALALSKRALDNREKSLGPTHPDTLLSLNHQAQLLRRLGRGEEARLLEERAKR